MHLPTPSPPAPKNKITRETLDSKSKGEQRGTENKNATFLRGNTQPHYEQYPTNSLRVHWKLHFNSATLITRKSISLTKSYSYEVWHRRSWWFSVSVYLGH